MNCFMIGIAGGTGAGKSTFARRLKDALGSAAVLIAHDSYYKNRPDLPPQERARLNYDHPDALETELMIRHLRLLREGTPIQRPRYDFSLHLRAPETVEERPAPIVIAEGILLFHDPRLRSLFDLKIYVDADADERILRRAGRDMAQRGRSLPDIARQYLDTVKPMHDRFVEPTKAFADIVIPGRDNSRAFELVRLRAEQALRDMAAR